MLYHYLCVSDLIRDSTIMISATSMIKLLNYTHQLRLTRGFIHATRDICIKCVIYPEGLIRSYKSFPAFHNIFQSVLIGKL